MKVMAAFWSNWLDWKVVSMFWKRAGRTDSEARMTAAHKTTKMILI